MSDPIELACAARRDYLPHAATMLASALANAGAPLRAHILVGNDIGETELRALGSMLAAEGSELIPHRMAAKRFAGLTTTGSLPTAHWYRTLLPELLDDAERAIYLDSDLLVLDSLLPLRELELGDGLLAAVTNVFPEPKPAAAYCAALGVDPECYFNSGVMVLDLAGLRDFASFERIREFALSPPTTLILPEQDAMNAVLGPRRVPLEPRWNLMTALIRLPHAAERFPPPALEAAIADPAIRHFEGSVNKPWQPQAEAGERRLWMSWAERIPAKLTEAGGAA